MTDDDAQPDLYGRPRPVERDSIYTPPRLADAVVERLHRDGYLVPGGWVVEPSAGDGALVRPLSAAGHSVIGVDLDPNARGGQWCDRYLCADWLTLAPTLRTALHLLLESIDVDAVVGNPPFGGPDDDPTYVGARHAIAALDVAPVVAMILPGCWIVMHLTEKQDPCAIWRDTPPAVVIPIRGRPFGDSLREAAVYVWRRGYTGPTVVASEPIQSALGWRS